MVSAEMSVEVGTLDVTTKREKMTQGGLRRAPPILQKIVLIV
jgi:hypothetical protein